MSELDEARAINEKLRDFIAASEDCAKAADILWYADECERMRAAFQKFAAAAAAGDPITFEASGCEWCHQVWPKPEGSTLDQVQERARRHIYSCASHPLKIERDALAAEVTKLKRDLRGPLGLAIEQRDAALDREDKLRSENRRLTALHSDLLASVGRMEGENARLHQAIDGTDSYEHWTAIGQNIALKEETAALRTLIGDIEFYLSRSTFPSGESYLDQINPALRERMTAATKEPQ